MSAAFGRLGVALLTLCARSVGWRNDSAGRAELEQVTGRAYGSSDVSPRIRRYANRGFISAPANSPRCATWRTTREGSLKAQDQATLAPGRRKRGPGVKVAGRGNWNKAPLVGAVEIVPRSVIHTPAPVLARIDPRYQIDPDTFKGGEFMAEWRRLRGQA